jgi:membrane protease YdiL (CAAX protease family)
MEEDIPGPGVIEPSVSDGGPDKLMKCRFCGRNLEQFFALGSVYCPFCGAVVNADRVPKLSKKDSNIIAGRALWSLKWSLLSVLAGMGILITFTLGVTILVIVIVILASPVSSLFNTTALENAAIEAISGPAATAALSLLEYAMLIPVFVALKKFRRPFKENIMLLGWKPYFGPRAVSPDGWRRFSIDIGVASIIAMALVGFQFAAGFASDAFWSQIIPNVPDVQGMAASTTAQNPFEFIFLVATMLLVVAPAEELLFRGFSQQGLESRLGERNAWLISSLLFAFVHVFTFLISPATIPLFPYFFFPYLYLSMVLCGIYWKTKDLNRMIYIHGIYDSLLVLYSSIIPLSSGNSSDLFAIISMVFGLFVLSIWLVRKFMARKANIPLVVATASGSRE